MGLSLPGHSWPTPHPFPLLHSDIPRPIAGAVLKHLIHVCFSDLLIPLPLLGLKVFPSHWPLTSRGGWVVGAYLMEAHIRMQRKRFVECLHIYLFFLNVNAFTCLRLHVYVQRKRFLIVYRKITNPDHRLQCCPTNCKIAHQGHSQIT